MLFFVLTILVSPDLLLPSECSESNIGILQNYGSHTITDNTLRQVLENFRSIVGQHTEIPRQQLFINQTGMFLNASFTDGSITDLSSFTTDLAHVNMTTLDFFTRISYTALSVSGDYKLFFDNDYVHIEGSDQLSADIENITMSLYLKLNQTKDQTLQLENITVDYNMAVKVELRHLGGNQQVSDTINKLINDMMPNIIQSTKPEIQKTFKEIAIERSKFFIGGMSLQQFIDFINSIIDS